MSTVCTQTYTTRILPAEEWHRLLGTELDEFVPLLDPTYTQIVVVEHDGEIVASWAATRLVHLEGIWISPAYRKSPSVGRRLLLAARQAVRSMGATWALTGCASEDVRAMLDKVGARRLPMDAYVMPVAKEKLCQPPL